MDWGWGQMMAAKVRRPWDMCMQFMLGRGWQHFNALGEQQTCIITQATLLDYGYVGVCDANHHQLKAG